MLKLGALPAKVVRNVASTLKRSEVLQATDAKKAVDLQVKMFAKVSTKLL